MVSIKKVEFSGAKWIFLIFPWGINSEKVCPSPALKTVKNGIAQFYTPCTHHHTKNFNIKQSETGLKNDA